jgi:hypothetical protein
MARDIQEMIRLKAYEIWEREGFPEGREKEHWERAERELGLVSTDQEGSDSSLDRTDADSEGASATTSSEGDASKERQTRQ